jgi:hypothetical protein
VDSTVEVAVLATSDFSADMLDPATIRFGPAAASPIGPIVERDVDSDGDPDWIYTFKFVDTGIDCGESVGILTGSLASGLAIEGQEPLEVAGCD